MLFFMVQVAVQSVKIEVIDEQEDDQRSGHAAGHYRKVVDVVDRQRHDDQEQVVDPHGSHQSVEPDVLNHFVFDFSREKPMKRAPTTVPMMAMLFITVSRKSQRSKFSPKKQIEQPSRNAGTKIAQPIFLKPLGSKRVVFIVVLIFR